MEKLISFPSDGQSLFPLKATKSRFLLLDEVDVRMIEPKPRSIRLDGMSTCIRLEGLYWGLLKSIAESNQMTTNKFLTELDRNVQMSMGDARNFTSLIRVLSTLQLLKACPDPLRDMVLENLA